MSDSEIFKDEPKKIEIEVKEVTPEQVSEPVKKERKKRVLSDEHKERLREQLKRGRQTSMANRQKKGLAKKLAKKEENDAQDAILAESLLKRSKKDTPTQAPSEPKSVKVAVPKQMEKSKESIELELLKKEFADFKINFSGKSPSLDHTQNDVIEKEQPKLEIKTFTLPPPPAQPKIAMMRRKRGTFN